MRRRRLSKRQSFLGHKAATQLVNSACTQPCPLLIHTVARVAFLKSKSNRVAPLFKPVHASPLLLEALHAVVKALLKRSPAPFPATTNFASFMQAECSLPLPLPGTPPAPPGCLTPSHLPGFTSSALPGWIWGPGRSLSLCSLRSPRAQNHQED